MHIEAHSFVDRILSTLARSRKETQPFNVVEIGSKDINGSIRPLVCQRLLPSRYVGIDPQFGPGVDIVADGATYDPDFPVHLVVCCEVLEHASTAREIIENAHKMLEKKGHLIITAAAPPRAPHSAIHGGPLQSGEFYRNVDSMMLADWLDGFRGKMIEYDPTRGDIYAHAIK